MLLKRSVFSIVQFLRYTSKWGLIKMKKVLVAIILIVVFIFLSAILIEAQDPLLQLLCIPRPGAQWPIVGMGLTLTETEPLTRGQTYMGET